VKQAPDGSLVASIAQPREGGNHEIDEDAQLISGTPLSQAPGGEQADMARHDDDTAGVVGAALLGQRFPEPSLSLACGRCSVDGASPVGLSSPPFLHRGTSALLPHGPYRWILAPSGAWGRVRSLRVSHCRCRRPSLSPCPFPSPRAPHFRGPFIIPSCTNALDMNTPTILSHCMVLYPPRSFSLRLPLGQPPPGTTPMARLVS
jgi:hypothetical protein